MRQILVLCCLIILTGCSAKQSDSELIQKVFQTYRSALLELKGADASDCLDSKSLMYYDELVSDALTLPRNDYESLDIMSKIMVSRMRLEIPKAQLENMSGRDFFIYSIEKGWTSSSSVSQIDHLVNITSDGRLAQAAIPQAPHQKMFYFINENREWKMAIWKLQALGEAVFKKQIEDSGMNEDQYIRAILESVSKYKWDDQIYDGPVR